LVRFAAQYIVAGRAAVKSKSPGAVVTAPAVAFRRN
jgi:hypothetical protein